MSADDPRMSDALQIRVHGDASLPTLIYLPGLHGDWLLVTRFRLALAGRVRFVEFTYPHTVTWSLDDYAAAVEGKLREHGIASGWLLAESFGSQVAWPLLQSQSFRAEGLILAGGFARHPWLAAVRATEWLVRLAPLAWLTAIVSGYGWWRGGGSSRTRRCWGRCGSSRRVGASRCVTRRRIGCA